MEGADVYSKSSQPQDILVANLNKSLEDLSSKYIVNNRFDKYFN